MGVCVCDGGRCTYGFASIPCCYQYHEHSGGRTTTSDLIQASELDVCAWVCLGLGTQVYQRRPTWRIHLAGAEPLGIPHADGLQPYNHQPAEMNVWVPLTAVSGSNSLTAESAPGAGDFHAFEVGPPPPGASRRAPPALLPSLPVTRRHEQITTAAQCLIPLLLSPHSLCRSYMRDSARRTI